MPYCLSCRNHFDTIAEMETIDCNRMGLCKECGNVKDTKRILITGIREGYIGSNIKAYCKTREGIDIVQNSKTISYVVDDFIPKDIDGVIHLAAISGVRTCEVHTGAAINTNIVGTIRVVEECKERGIPVWLASSFAAIQPENVYGYTKQFAEYLTERYELGFSFVLSNVYGGINFERKTSVLSTWMKVLLMGLPIVICGDGTQERDFIHVQDVARMMIDQVNIQLRGGPSYKKFYICSGVKTSINDLYKIFKEEFGLSIEPKYEPDAFVGIKTPYIVPPMPRCAPRISLRNGIYRLHTGFTWSDHGV